MQNNIRMSSSERGVWVSGSPICHHIRGWVHEEHKHASYPRATFAQPYKNFSLSIYSFMTISSSTDEFDYSLVKMLPPYTYTKAIHLKPSRHKTSEGHNCVGSTETFRSCNRCQLSCGGGLGASPKLLQTFRWITPFQQCTIAMDESTRNHAETQLK